MPDGQEAQGREGLQVGEVCRPAGEALLGFEKGARPQAEAQKDRKERGGREIFAHLRPLPLIYFFPFICMQIKC